MYMQVDGKSWELTADYPAASTDYLAMLLLGKSCSLSMRPGLLIDVEYDKLSRLQAKCYVHVQASGKPRHCSGRSHPSTQSQATTTRSHVVSVYAISLNSFFFGIRFIVSSDAVLEAPCSVKIA